MEKGVIFFANKRQYPDAIHPIIFWGEESNGFFLGLMITNSPDYGNLDLSNAGYFQDNAEEFQTTHIVKALLLKPVDWLVNYRVLGQLSRRGIEYVDTVVNHMQPITWEKYLQS